MQENVSNSQNVNIQPNKNIFKERPPQSGGFYICTIQKFCDRKDDLIGLINDRSNIICFSDEAHRTQLDHSKKYSRKIFLKNIKNRTIHDNFCNNF